MIKRSIPAIAINNDCWKMSGRVADVTFPHMIKDKVVSVFWDRKGRKNFTEFATQRCVPNSNPNRVM